MTNVAISADEALLWLRDYQSETARLGLDAIAKAQDAIQIINEVMAAGGWAALEAKNSPLAASYRTQLTAIKKQHEDIRRSLIARRGTN